MNLLKYRFVLIFIFIFALAIFSGAFFFQDAFTYTTPTDVQKRWLAKIPCSSPCWENIYPGVTSAEESLMILNASTLVANIRVEDEYQYSIPYVGTQGLIRWDWKSGKGGGYVIYHVYESKRIVDEIRLVGCCMKLSDLIRSFGEPQYAWTNSRHRYEGIPITQMSPNFVYRILWASQGIEASGVTDTYFNFDQNLLLNDVTLSVSELKRYSDSEGNLGAYLYPWKGYAYYTSYLVER